MNRRQVCHFFIIAACLLLHNWLSLSQSLFLQSRQIQLRSFTHEESFVTMSENKSFEPFQKQHSRLRDINIKTKKITSVELGRVCGMPEFFDDMVGCEVKRCRKMVS